MPVYWHLYTEVYNQVVCSGRLTRLGGVVGDWETSAGRRPAAGFLAVPAHSCFLPASYSYQSVLPPPGRHLKLGRIEGRTWSCFCTERCAPWKIQEFHRPISDLGRWINWNSWILQGAPHLNWQWSPVEWICGIHVKSFTIPAIKFVSGDPQTVNPYYFPPAGQRLDLYLLHLNTVNSDNTSLQS